MADFGGGDREKGSSAYAYGVMDRRIWLSRFGATGFVAYAAAAVLVAILCVGDVDASRPPSRAPAGRARPESTRYPIVTEISREINKDGGNDGAEGVSSVRRRAPGGSVEEWLAAGTVASWAGLDVLPKLVVPIALNVVFIGGVPTELEREGANAFGAAADAAAALGLGDDFAAVRRWAAHIDHTVHLTTLAPGGNGVIAGKSDDVVFEYRLNVVNVSESVHRLISTFITSSARRDVPLAGLGKEDLDSMGRSVHYVPASLMEDMLGSLANHLQMFIDRRKVVDDRVAGGAYFLFVLNPDVQSLARSAGVASGALVHGYRDGISEGELAALAEDAEVASRVTAEWQARAARRRDNEDFNVYRPAQRPPDDSGGHEHEERVRLHDLQHESATWARTWERLQLSHRGGDTRGFGALEIRTLGEQVLDGKWGDALRERTLADLRGKIHALSSRDGQMSELDGVEFDDDATESCVVDTWVGVGRLAWIDLSGGPFAWGPVVGGDGVKPIGAFGTPRLPPRIAAKAAAAEAARHTKHAGGQSDARAPSSRGLGSLQGQRRDPSLRDVEDEVVWIEGEHAVLEAVLSESCLGNAQSDFCTQLRERMLKVRDYVAQLRRMASEIERAGISASAEIRAMVGRILPRRAEVLEALVVAAESEADALDPNAVRVAGSLVPLVHSVSDFIRGVLTPSSQLQALLPPSVTDDSCAVLAARPATVPNRIAVQLLVVSDHNSYEPLGHGGFDAAAFRDQVAAVVMPEQELSFSVHRIRLEDDPAVAMAYTSSMRYALQPRLSPRGAFSSETRSYLDSRALALQLAEVSDAAELSSSAAQGSASATLNVPVFLFSSAGEAPLYIDRHYLARSACGMVFVSQSNALRVASHVGCNDKAVALNLRNPLLDAVAATIGAIGGVVPAHATSDGIRLVQRWLWSVGHNTGSQTGRAATVVSAFAVDTAQRNVVLGALASSRRRIDGAIDRLRTLKTAESNAIIRGWQDWAAVTDDVARVTKTWRNVVYHIAAGDTSAAAAHIGDVDELTKEVESGLLSLAERLRSSHCSTPTPAAWSTAVWNAVDTTTLAAAAAASVAGAAILKALSPHSTKAKIN